jgi:hypothetical protein
MKRFLALAALVLVGCTSSQTVSTVEAVVSATEAVVALLPGIPAPVKAEVSTYLGLADDGATCVTDELATTDTGVARALKIAQCFSSVSYTGLSPQAQAYVAAVNAAVKALLAFYPPSGANTVTVTSAQKASLQALHVRAQVAKQR